MRKNCARFSSLPQAQRMQIVMYHRSSKFFRQTSTNIIWELARFIYDSEKSTTPVVLHTPVVTIT